MCDSLVFVSVQKEVPIFDQDCTECGVRQSSPLIAARASAAASLGQAGGHFVCFWQCHTGSHTVCSAPRLRVSTTAYDVLIGFHKETDVAKLSIWRGMGQ